jgi:hypothetical protein
VSGQVQLGFCHSILQVSSLGVRDDALDLAPMPDQASLGLHEPLNLKPPVSHQVVDGNGLQIL